MSRLALLRATELATLKSNLHFASQRLANYRKSHADADLNEGESWYDDGSYRIPLEHSGGGIYQPTHHVWPIHTDRLSESLYLFAHVDTSAWNLSKQHLDDSVYDINEYGLAMTDQTVTVQRTSSPYVRILDLETERVVDGMSIDAMIIISEVLECFMNPVLGPLKTTPFVRD